MAPQAPAPADPVDRGPIAAPVEGETEHEGDPAIDRCCEELKYLATEGEPDERALFAAAGVLCRSGDKSNREGVFETIASTVEGAGKQLPASCR